MGCFHTASNVVEFYVWGCQSQLHVCIPLPDSENTDEIGGSQLGWLGQIGVRCFTPACVCVEVGVFSAQNTVEGDFGGAVD